VFIFIGSVCVSLSMLVSVFGVLKATFYVRIFEDDQIGT
jgi:hypothetical protein